MMPWDARTRGSHGRRRHDDPRAGPQAKPTVPHDGAERFRPGALTRSRTMQTLRGIAVSPGVAIGPSLVIDPRGQRLPRRAIAAEAVDAELERLDRGLESAYRHAEQAEAEARERLGPQYADILSAHARMIADPTLRRDARLQIECEHLSA